MVESLTDYQYLMVLLLLVLILIIGLKSIFEDRR